MIPRQEPHDEWRAELRRFLEQLCDGRAGHGYCSLGKREEDILSCERFTAKEFALAVLRAEGFEHPEYEIRLQRNLVQAFVERYGRSVITAREFREF